jgi:membrane protease YdiL (CAAX protease family)
MNKKWSFRVWGFIAAIYLASGLLWIPVLLSGQGMSIPINMVLLALIAFMPSMMGIIFTYLVKDPQERHDFWQRTFRWPSAKLPLILAGLMVLPVLNISAYILTFHLLGKDIPMEYAKEMLSNVPLLLQFILIEVTFGPLSEELGWRGYLLDEMQSRCNALTSALVLGVFWGLWHTPTFLVPGLIQNKMGGIFSTAYLSFIITAIMISVLQTWIYNNTGRSTLVAGILMHLFANASLVFMAGIFDRFSMPDAYWIILIVLYSLVTATIVTVWGPKSLARKLFRRKIYVENGPLGIV